MAIGPYGLAAIRPLPSLLPQRQRRYTPEEEDSILRKLGRGTVSGLVRAAHFLDTPGSVVRGLLADKPGRAFGGVFSPEKRVYGREMLQKWGMLGRNRKGFDWGDVAGFGAEVVTDPLAWLSLGGAAVSRGGKVAKLANLMQHAQPAAAAKAAGALGTKAQRAAVIAAAKRGAVPGIRQAKLSGTVDDLIKFAGAEGPAALKAAEQAADDMARGMGKSLASIRHQRLGSLVGVAPPFMQPRALGGTGPMAQRIAGGMDVLGQAIRHGRYSPIPKAAQLFHPASGDLIGKRAQRFAEKATAGMTAARTGPRGQTARFVQTLQEAGAAKVLDPDDLPTMREYFEHVNTAPSQIEPMIKEMDDTLADSLLQNKALGMPADPLEDIISYFPRQKTSVVGETGEAFTSTLRKEPGRFARYKNVPGGTGPLMRLHANVGLNDLIDSNAPLADVVAEIRRIAPGLGVPDSYITKAGVVKKTGRYNLLAKSMMHEASPVRRAGLWGNHPVYDYSRRVTIGKEQRALVNAAYDDMATYSMTHAEAAASGGPTVAIKDVLRSLGLKGGDLTNGAYTQIVRLLLDDSVKMLSQTSKTARMRYLQSIGSRRIPKELADGIVKFGKAHLTNDAADAILPIVDSLTNVWKASVTAGFPAFHARNLVSGLYRSFIDGTFSPQGARDANALLRGGIIRDAHIRYPIVKRMLAERGINATAENGTHILRELVYSHDVASRRAGEAISRVGGQQAIESSLAGLTKQVAGQQPYRFGRAGKQLLGMKEEGTTRNPLGWRVRGVAGAPETTMPVLRAGEEIGFWVEGINRGTPFLTQLRKGTHPVAAAKQTAFAQVEYARHGFTAFESKYMKRAFPFYAFASRQIPFVLRQLWEHPGGRMAQTVRGIAGARDRDTALPSHVGQGAAIQLPKGPSGQPRYLTGLGLMMEDPFSFGGGGVRGTLMEAASRANPLVKGPAEWATGRSFFQRGPMGGRDLTDMDPTIGRLLANLRGGQRDPVSTPQWLEQLSANLPTARLLTTARTLTDPRKAVPGTRVPGGAVAANLLTGLRVTDVPESAQDAQLREATEALIQAIPGSRRFTISNVPQEALDKLPPEKRAAAEERLAALKILRQRAKDRAKRR